MLAIRTPTSVPLTYGSKRIWTVNHNKNKIFALHLEPRVSIVAFKKEWDAFNSAKVIESHVENMHEWPDLSGALDFYVKDLKTEDPLNFLDIKGWEFDNLKVWSAVNCLDLMMIDIVKKTKNGYRFIGNRYSFEGPTEMYIDRFNELYNLSDEDVYEGM